MPLCPTCGAGNLAGDDVCINCGADLTALAARAPSAEAERSLMDRPLTALEMTPIHAIGPDDPLEVAAFTLLRQKVGLLEVVEEGRLVGVLSEHDFIVRVGPDYHDKLARPVRQFMTPRPETLPSNAPITFALNQMDVGGYRHVPVVENGRMVGVVSSGDVIQYLIKNSRDDAEGELA